MIVSQNKIMLDPLEYAARIAYSSKKVLQFTYDQAVRYKDMPGCFVEAGCAAGAQVIALIAGGGPNKVVHAFDSFEGIPLPSNKDNQMPGLKFLEPWEQRALPDPGKQALVSSGATVVSKESFLEHVSNAFNHNTELYKNLYPIKGWFENTMSEASMMIDPIAILRLDSDLYNSTYVCLKYLYPKVIYGGLIIVDDYGLPGCRQAVFDYFFDNRDELNSFDMEFIEDKNSKVAYWIKK